MVKLARSKIQCFCKLWFLIKFINIANIKNIIWIWIAIVPPLTWISDVAAVLQNNFKPVFVDINPENLCMDEGEILKKINKKNCCSFLTMPRF